MTKFNNYLNPFSEEMYIDLFTNQSYIDYFNNINETFNKSAKITIDKSNPNIYSTSFEINDIKYIFMAEIEEKEAIIIFYPLDGEIDIFKERKKYNSYLGELFGSLIQSVQLMLKEKDLNKIKFTAYHKKLESIYNLLDKTIQKRFPRWKLDNVTRNKQGMLNYIYIKE